MAKSPSRSRRAASSRKAPAPLLRAHVIPNSHLDREWTLDYQRTRRLTVEFLDRLLDIFDEVPEYTFLLDSQTIPLEDYLEIRPENEERLRRAARAGRLSVGPWYTAPDPNTISGESLVRNLLVGHRVARRFGPPMKVGYTPFGFGQVSQLPQIYAGFGISTLFFYRGITSYETPAAEFLWQGPDGTEALCSRFGSKARYNFFMDVWRPVAFGKPFTERMYSWREGGLPFKRCNPGDAHEHYFLLRRVKSPRRDLLESSFRALLETERRHFTTPVLPLMQGMDTTKPDPLEAELVRDIRALLRPGEEIFFSTLERYAEDLRAHLDLRTLRRFTGEMRRPGPPSPFVTNLENIASARIRQKVAQHRAEKRLTRLAEPFAALAWANGALDYPTTFLDQAWRHLLQCHPHDTVAGCGIDKLERDALYRLDQVEAISDLVLDDALGSLLARIDNAEVGADEIVVTVFNPSPRPRTETIEVVLDVPHELNMPEFEIVDIRGRRAEQCFVHRAVAEKTVRDNTDLTMALTGWACTLQFRAEDVPAMGYKTYVARRCAPFGDKKRLAASPHCIENEFLRVDFQADGTFDLVEKSARRRWSGLHYLVDGGETGQAWESRPAGVDSLVSSRCACTKLSLEENTPLSATVRIRHEMRVPSGLIHNDSHHETRRGEREEDLLVESFVTLRAGARRLEVRTVIENKARNHRLRVFFPTGLSGAKTSAAETPFDVVERVIERDPGHPYSQANNPTYPCLRFADISDGKAGFAVLTQGLHEYEVTDDPSRTLALTLLRAFEVTLCTVSYRWERRPDQPLSQMPGTTEVRYAIYPHAGDWESGAVLREAEDFCLPLVAAQSGRGEGTLPREASLLEVQPASLVLSAVKKAEEGDALIVRLYNPAPRSVSATVRFARPPRRVRAVNFNEEPLPAAEAPTIRPRGNAFRATLAAKKVMTFEVAF
jgi:alpha-mannosidase